MDDKTAGEKWAELQKIAETQRAVQQKPHEWLSACPSCGYCPHCGRGGHQVAPFVAPIWRWTPPYYVQPQPTWISVTTGGNLPQVGTYQVNS